MPATGFGNVGVSNLTPDHLIYSGHQLFSWKDGLKIDQNEVVSNPGQLSLFDQLSNQETLPKSNHIKNLIDISCG
jgi:hypothetical protein